MRVLDGLFVLERPGDGAEVGAGAGVLAVVFGPDGTTVIRRDDAGADAWVALWNGDEAHDVQATGMLSAVVAPLGAGGVPVWAVSSYDGDIVLVPSARLEEACGLLRAAGHQVRR
ncbi:MAG: ACT domain-containing protein [Actinobacteria bacterium]|nr:ACT domain-containing protein [Actinomycetota bacterium]